MIFAKSTLKKIRIGLERISIIDSLLLMLYIVFIGAMMFARIMENQPIKQKALYDNNNRLIGYAVNGELYEFEVRDLPEGSKKLVEELQEASINVLLKDWMETWDVKAIQNNKPEVKLFKVEKGFWEGILYSQRCPVGICINKSNGTSVIYVDEDMYANKDLFINVYIHEYIHAMSKGASAFDVYKNGERKYNIVKEGYTEYLKDVVVKEGGLKQKYKMEEPFISAYENAKKLASVIDNVKLGNDYPIMREIFFEYGDCKNLIYDEMGQDYEELNRLLEKEPESEIISALLWRMECMF